jgi:hypothetical protein
MVWIVQITDYEDDYKHRYDNGIYPRDPEIFRTQKQAQNYVCEQIGNAVINWICDQDKDYDKELFEEREGELCIRNKYEHDMSTIRSLWEQYLRGSFVDYQVEWTITEKVMKGKKSQSLK